MTYHSLQDFLAKNDPKHEAQDMLRALMERDAALCSAAIRRRDGTSNGQWASARNKQRITLGSRAAMVVTDDWVSSREIADLFEWNSSRPAHLLADYVVKGIVERRTVGRHVEWRRGPNYAAWLAEQTQDRRAG